MDLEALQLNARFALPPNSLGYCGKNSAPEKFKCCVIDGACDGVGEEFKHFIVLYPYIQTLAKITGLPKFSQKVIESYWLGNDLLYKVKPQDYLTLLHYFEKQGVPSWLVEELKNTPPKKFIPTHLFQVLHVGVGRASGSVPYNLETINNCMIRWGEVTRITSNSATVNLNSLKKSGRQFLMTKITQTLPYISGFVPGLKKGDVVGVHWENIVKIFSQREVDNLTYWTKEVLHSFK